MSSAAERQEQKVIDTEQFIPNLVTGPYPGQETPSDLNPGLVSQLGQVASLPLRIVRNQIESIGQYGHDVVHGSYSPEFKHTIRDKQVFVASDDVPLSFRVFNKQYLNNGLAYGYNFSLLVPAKRGAEIPTLSDVVDHAAANKRATIATTTDGFSNHLDREQLWSLTNFHNLTSRRFELYRSILKPDQHLILAGASLGGMIAYDMAATQIEESETSHHPLYIDKIIAICSAGHNQYDARDLPAMAKQFTIDESRSAIEYALSAEGSKQKAQRFFELIGTLPAHKQHFVATALMAAGILKAPLIGVESRIPHTTTVVDEVYGLDTVTHPHLRAANWEKTDHPKTNLKLFKKDGLRHLALLTVGRATTVANLSELGPTHLTALSKSA